MASFGQVQSAQAQVLSHAQIATASGASAQPQMVRQRVPFVGLDEFANTMMSRGHSFQEIMQMIDFAQQNAAPFAIPLWLHSPRQYR